MSHARPLCLHQWIKVMALYVVRTTPQMRRMTNVYAYVLNAIFLAHTLTTNNSCADAHVE